MEIINFYNRVKRNENKLYDYKLKPLVKIDLPFRALLLGASGSGKTNLVLQLIKSINAFSKIVLIAKNLDEPLYKHLITTVREVERVNKERILLASSSLADLPAVNDFNPKENTFVIIDDFICESPKDLKVVEELWIRGRKNSVSMAFLSQSYFDTPKKIRRNSNYIMIKKIYNIPDLKRILKEYCLGVEPEELLKLYEYAVDGQFTNFFMIDLNTNDINQRFRKCFEPIKISSK